MLFPKVTVIGLGYVGLGQALLFNDVTTVVGYDINDEVVHLLQHGQTHINDDDIKAGLQIKPLTVTNDFSVAILDSALIIIATPTNFDEKTKAFDLSSVTLTLAKLNAAKVKAPILIKSTLQVGATNELQLAFPALTLFFIPEFLREGKSLYDNYFPSRIIIGFDEKSAKMQALATKIGLFYKHVAKNSATVPLLFTGTHEAEAIKLFSNTYLALRVAFFNEVDTFALTKKLDAREIIKGVSLDPRIGDFYNNPSFGYGGYCLPKDTKELQHSFALVPENLISATVKANETRKMFISENILKTLGPDYQKRTVGVYRLTMKKGASNMRESSILSVVEHLKMRGVNIVIYEPLIKKETYENIKVVSDLDVFKNLADIIITNRYDATLDDVKRKVFTRDLFHQD